MVDGQQVTITWAAVDIRVAPVGGLYLCLPAAARRALVLVHYAGSQWEPVAGSRDDAPERPVCAAGGDGVLAVRGGVRERGAALRVLVRT